MNLPVHARVRLLGNAPTARDWRLLRVEWPQVAAKVQPGQWLQLEFGARTAALAISHAAPDQGWLALLAPPPLNETLADIKPHSLCQVSGPYGDAFDLSAPRESPVLLATDAGIPAILFLCERLTKPPRLVLIGGDQPPPFRPAPSQFLLAGLPPAVIAAAPLLEAQGIPSRLANSDGLPGCFEGSVVDLLRLWLASQAMTPLDLLACVSAADAAALKELAEAGGHRLQCLPPPIDGP